MSWSLMRVKVFSTSYQGKLLNEKEAFASQSFSWKLLGKAQWAFWVYVLTLFQYPRLSLGGLALNYNRQPNFLQISSLIIIYNQVGSTSSIQKFFLIKNINSSCVFWLRTHHDLDVMHSLQVFTEYFKELEEESIRDNFVIIYELLDELVDFGYPQFTETKILQE